MGPPTKKGGTIRCIDVEGGRQSVTCTGPINLKDGKAYVCLTGLSQEDKNTLVNLFKEYAGHKIEIDNGAELHPKTTHLLVKEAMVGKTDKLLGSLARGDVTICDHRPFLEIARQEVISESKASIAIASALEDKMDVGGRENYAIVFPELSKRKALKKKGGPFRDWKVGLTPFGPDFKEGKVVGTGFFDCCFKILVDGGAKSVYKIDLPFDPKAVKQAKLDFILSSPPVYKADQALKDFVDQTKRTHVLHYNYIYETLKYSEKVKCDDFDLRKKNMKELDSLTTRVIAAKEKIERAAPVARKLSTPVVIGATYGVKPSAKNPTQATQGAAVKKRPLEGVKQNEVEASFIVSYFESPIKRPKLDPSTETPSQPPVKKLELEKCLDEETPKNSPAKNSELYPDETPNPSPVKKLDFGGQGRTPHGRSPNGWVLQKDLVLSKLTKLKEQSGVAAAGSPIRPFQGVLTQRQQSTPSQAPTKKAPPPQSLPRYATPTKGVFREVPQKANASILKFLFQAGGDSKEKENVAIVKKTDEAKENQSKSALDHEWGTDELFQSANTSARKIITNKGDNIENDSWIPVEKERVSPDNHSILVRAPSSLTRKKIMEANGFDQSEIDAVMEHSSKKVPCLTRSNYSAAFERCQLQKAQSGIKGLEWSDSAVLPKYKGERYVEEYCEADDAPEILGPWFNTWTETYIDCDDLRQIAECDDDLHRLDPDFPEGFAGAGWKFVLDQMESCTNRYWVPSGGVLGKMARDAMLNNESPIIRQSALIYWKSLLMKIPPSSDALVKLYSKILSPEKGMSFTPERGWDNFHRRLREAVGINSHYRHAGCAVWLEAVMTLMEADLCLWLEKCYKGGRLFVTWPILSRIIWHEGDEGTVNDHVRMIVKLYHRVIKKSVVSLKPGFMSEYLRKLVGMVAQLVDMCAKTKDSHALRKELAETIGSEFNASCSGNDEIVFAELYLLEPDWLSALVTQTTLREVYPLGGGPGVPASDFRGVDKQLQDFENLTIAEEPRTEHLDAEAEQLKTPKNSKIADGKPSEEDNSSQRPIPTITLSPLSPNKPKEYALPKNFNPQKKNIYGETKLHTACKTGQADQVRAILNFPNVDVNLRDNNGWTALHEACAHGRVECVHLLLKHRSKKTIESFFKKGQQQQQASCSNSGTDRVDLFAVAGEDGLTPLHDAIQHKHFSIVSMYLDAITANDRRTGDDGLIRMVKMKTGQEGKTVWGYTRDSADMTALIQSKLVEAGHYDRQIVEGMVNNQPPPSSAADKNIREDKKKRLVSARDARRYLYLSSLYLHKYVSVFRLPMTKNLMKMDIPNPSANRTFGAGGWFDESFQNSIRMVDENEEDSDIEEDMDPEGTSIKDEVNTQISKSQLTSFSIPWASGWENTGWNDINVFWWNSNYQRGIIGGNRALQYALDRI